MKSDFDWERYQSQLSTKFLGQIVIYSKIVNSTFDLLEGPKPLGHGLAVIASRQIKGRYCPENLTLTRFEFPPCLSANHDHVFAESTNHSIK